MDFVDPNPLLSMQPWDYDYALTPIAFPNGTTLQTSYETDYGVDLDTSQQSQNRIEQWTPAPIAEERSPARDDTAAVAEYVCYGTVSLKL